jgi:hypothetical protein
MSQVVIFLPSDPTVANRAKEFLPSANTPDYSGNTDALINPDLSSVAGVAVKYWKRSGNSVVEMSAGEKASLDTAEATALTLAIRTAAKAMLDSFASDPLFQRALADILKDEINIVRAWTVSLKAAIASASTLAQVKTNVAALDTLNARTLAQLKTAIQNRIDDGSVDS